MGWSPAEWLHMLTSLQTSVDQPEPCVGSPLFPASCWGKKKKNPQDWTSALFNLLSLWLEIKSKVVPVGSSSACHHEFRLRQFELKDYFQTLSVMQIYNVTNGYFQRLWKYDAKKSLCLKYYLIHQNQELFSATSPWAQMHLVWIRVDRLWKSGSIDSGLTSWLVKLQGLTVKQPAELTCFSSSPHRDFFERALKAPKSGMSTCRILDQTRLDQSDCVWTPLPSGMGGCGNSCQGARVLKEGP